MRKRRLRVNKWQLAEVFRVHAHTVHLWQKHEGLGVAALVQPGRPGDPALFDGEQAVAWFNVEKSRTHHRRCTLEDLRAIVREDRTSAAGPATETDGNPKTPRRPRAEKRSSR